MNKGDKVEIILSTPEDETEIAAQLARDPDTYQWTGEEGANAKPTQKLSAEAYEQVVRREEALKAGLIERITITLDREMVAWSKAQTRENGEAGEIRWVELVEQTLSAPVQAPTDQKP